MRRTMMNRWTPMVVPTIGMWMFCTVSRAEPMAHFEDLGLGPDSYWNGSDGSGGFSSCGFSFNNVYDFQWESWGGWAYSSMTEGNTPGWENQYSAKPGSGAVGSNTYGVAYYSGWPAETIPTIAIPDGHDVPDGVYVTNTAYAYFAMSEGDDFVNQFDPNDWQKLTITGKSGPAVVDLQPTSGAHPFGDVLAQVGVAGGRARHDSPRAAIDAVAHEAAPVALRQELFVLHGRVFPVGLVRFLLPQHLGCSTIMHDLSASTRALGPSSRLDQGQQ